MATKKTTAAAFPPVSNKSKANGAPPAPPPVPETKTEVAPPTPPAPPPAPLNDPAEGFRKYLRGMTGERMLVLVEGNETLKAEMANAFFDFEERRKSFEERRKAMEAEAAEFGLAMNKGAPGRKKGSVAKPNPNRGAAVDPELAAKVLADVQAHPGTKSKDSQGRLGITADQFAAAKALLLADGKIVQVGLRGPHVNYTVA